MTTPIERIISKHRRGVKLTSADAWELKYEFRVAVVAALKEKISYFGVGDLAPWEMIMRECVDQLEEEAYLRGIEEGKKEAGRAA